MANHGRSSDVEYPGGQYPPGRGRPASPPPSVWRTGARAPVGSEPPPPESWPGPAGPMPAAPTQTSQLPPPEWADPAVGRRWTSSWRVPPTGAQPTRPAMPGERPAPPPSRSNTGAFPRSDTGAFPRSDTGAIPRMAPVRETAGNPALAATRTTGAIRTTGATRTTGAITTTGAMKATGGMRTAGAVRTAKPIAPGTGRARIVLPIVVLALIAAGLAGVMYLWWRNTLFIHAHGALLVDIGEVLGLLSGYGVIVLVALMARLPPLERGIGTDRLARWHSIGGRYVVGTTSGHVVFIVWGYAVT